MTTGQKIYEARRRAGYTQEELADFLGVTRREVEDWESDAALPETHTLQKLCKLLSLSADDLLFGSTPPKNRVLEDYGRPMYGRIPHPGELHFEYVSKTHVGSLPLLHINFGLGMYRAKGIFAIGNIATGIWALGLLSLGLLSFGILALGLFAFGSVAAGLLMGAGAVALGVLACGGVAIGVFSFGGAAIGYLAVGGAAVGQYAVGDWAQGFVAVGIHHANGTHAFLMPGMYGELEAFICENAPPYLVEILKSVASALK